MVKKRDDVKKIQILCEYLDDEVHYIEKSGTHYVYSYLSAHGDGLIHQIEPRNIDIFIRELYAKFFEHYSQMNSNIAKDHKTDVEKDLATIKSFFK